MSQTSRPKELTIRALILGVVLSAILSAANAYLGLFAGMTVSASIPAAVVSMGLMKAVRGSILENNLVQTAASAGESAAAGAIFTLPALLLLGSWARFPWLDCFLLVGSGGVLGVLFTIVLRVPLIVEGKLPYPEGVATAQVLVAGHRGDQMTEGAGQRALDSVAEPKQGARVSPLRSLSLGGLVGASYKLMESGLGLCQATVQGATRLGGATFYMGVGASPALLAVGYIVGLRIAFVVCLGGLINWLLVVPWLSEATNEITPLDAAWTAWSTQTRYLGVGAMTFSGLFTLVQLRSTLKRAVVEGIGQLSRLSPAVAKEGKTEDLSFRWLLGGILACTLLLLWMFSRQLSNVYSALVVTLCVLAISFLFSAVAAYMAGLLGSSNNPVSGVTIATIIVMSAVLIAVGVDSRSGAQATIFVGSVVCTAAAIGGDNMQDLKAGHLLGASPRLQQVMQLAGVVVAALVLGPILQLLSDSYGFFEPTAAHPHPLMAPQASLMASVARGMFGSDLPWGLIGIGLGIGALFSGLDTYLRHRKAHLTTPPLALSLGLYLPLELSTPVLLGGLASHVVRRARPQAHSNQAGPGVLLSAGLITGEALMGVVLAAVLLLVSEPARFRVELHSSLLSLFVMGAVFALLVRTRKSSDE